MTVTDRTLTVAETGPLTLVEDMGRPGHADTGVTGSGAFDRASARQANVAVGNPPDAPLLEVLLGGLDVTAGCPVTVAVTGIDAPLTVHPAAGRARPGHTRTVVRLAAGDRLVLGTATSGLRGYVAFSGGVDAAFVLGSASTDTLGSLGPAPVRPTAVVVDVVPGPREDRVAPESVETFYTRVYRVTPQSDRVGVRLDGPPLTTLGGSLPSEGTVRGTIQVPPSGVPTVFGPDPPVTGGYPVIGVATPESVDALAQAAPGTEVRFRRV
ncbi:biotin-dependent carboxyltransferase family protein [Corynebacterium bovis]|uniref:5-oxoprolinase subunit C family protein n=1 Tax=Corynebacterium bovis TaxID=36808 RepID=UPI003138A356